MTRLIKQCFSYENAKAAFEYFNGFVLLLSSMLAGALSHLWEMKSH